MTLNTVRIPTSVLQKGLLAFGSAVTALRNPMRAGYSFLIFFTRLLDFLKFKANVCLSLPHMMNFS